VTIVWGVRVLGEEEEERMEAAKGRTPAHQRLGILVIRWAVEADMESLEGGLVAGHLLEVGDMVDFDLMELRALGATPRIS
jgi:hypothetical protein